MKEPQTTSSDRVVVLEDANCISLLAVKQVLINAGCSVVKSVDKPSNLSLYYEFVTTVETDPLVYLMSISVVIDGCGGRTLSVAVAFPEDEYCLALTLGDQLSALGPDSVTMVTLEWLVDSDAGNFQVIPKEYSH